MDIVLGDSSKIKNYTNMTSMSEDSSVFFNTKHELSRFT